MASKGARETPEGEVRKEEERDSKVADKGAKDAHEAENRSGGDSDEARGRLTGNKRPRPTREKDRGNKQPRTNDKREKEKPKAAKPMARPVGESHSRSPSSSGSASPSRSHSPISPKVVTPPKKTVHSKPKTPSRPLPTLSTSAPSPSPRPSTTASAGTPGSTSESRQTVTSASEPILETDPTRLKQLLEECRRKLEVSENSLEAWKALGTQITTRKDASPDQVRGVVDKLRQDIVYWKGQKEAWQKRWSDQIGNLTQLEKDTYELGKYNKELRANMSLKAMQMRTTFMDPLINDNFKLLQEGVKEYEKKLKSVQEDLKATQFSAETYEGKQLIAKCRKLHDENEKFGRELNEGRLHKMETELAREKKQNAELHEAISESHEWVMSLDEEIEDMQTTIFKLQAELKRYKDRGSSTSTNTSPTSSSNVSNSPTGNREDQTLAPNGRSKRSKRRSRSSGGGSVGVKSEKHTREPHHGHNNAGTRRETGHGRETRTSQD